MRWRGRGWSIARLSKVRLEHGDGRPNDKRLSRFGERETRYKLACRESLNREEEVVVVAVVVVVVVVVGELSLLYRHVSIIK